MLKIILAKTSLNHLIFKKSPWDDSEEKENIFTRPRTNNKFNFDFNTFQFNNIYIVFILVALSFLWLASGIYEVQEGEEAAVVRFGRFVRKGYPGLNYHLPKPFETIEIQKINKSRRIEIGYKSSGSSNFNASATKANSAESAMLTGDENIVELNCDVMWHISDLEKFIFNIASTEEAVRTTAESAIREVIGNTPISSVLSDQKQEITNKIERLTQKILDQYNAGVSIENVQLLKAEPPAEVLDAYRDVQTSEADKEREINQAQSYKNDILPKARGEAAKILEEAKGYKQEIIAKAQGDSKRFLSIYEQYVINKQLTRDRLYLEAVEMVLKGSDKTIVSPGMMLPHMAVEQKVGKVK